MEFARDTSFREIEVDLDDDNKRYLVHLLDNSVKQTAPHSLSEKVQSQGYSISALATYFEKPNIDGSKKTEQNEKDISIDYVGKIIGSTPEKDLENVFDSMSQTCKINLTNFLIHNRLKEGMLQKNYLMSHIHKNHIGVLNAAISTIQVIV